VAGAGNGSSGPSDPPGARGIPWRLVAAGVSLIALGVTCWPGAVMKQALRGMLAYSLLVTLYFVILGLDGTWVGVLL
jgi:hypothetical protein